MVLPAEPAAALPSAQKQSLESISDSIQRSLALLHQIHCSVSAFTLPSQLTLLERLYAFLSPRSKVGSEKKNHAFGQIRRGSVTSFLS
jgi:hypothetical protein